MRKFLVPVDGSLAAVHALTHAIELARDLGQTRLVVINVQPDLDHSYHGGLLNPEALADLRRTGEEAAVEARKMLDEAGIDYEFAVIFGQPAEVIARVAKEQHCKGVILGTHAQGELRNALLGSAAHRVVELCEVPVTLVR
jgi:nucleotide-binding universal stress UspA family protein